MADVRLDFDWDRANISHLQRHRVSTAEFEEVLRNGTLDLDYQTEDGEDRIKSLGETSAGRVLIVVYAIRASRIRAVTAYPANRILKKYYREGVI